MVKFNPMESRDLSIVRGHPSTKKKNYLRKVPITAELPTRAQAEARLALSEFATTKLYGLTGTVILPDGRRISAGAYSVMSTYPHRGVGVFGGMSPSDRAAQKHALAPASIAKQREKIERMRGAGRVGTPGLIPM